MRKDIDCFNSEGLKGYEKKFMHEGYKFSAAFIREGFAITRLNKGLNNTIILFYELKNDK